MKVLIKFFAVVGILAICCLISTAQTSKKDEPKFDRADFSRKFEVVEWLVEYDNVAWKTTDVLMAQSKSEMSKLGAEWFCFQDKNKAWHAVYGKLTDGKYDLVFHFVMDPASKITRTTEKIDQEFLDSHAIALKTATTKLAASIPADSPRFNQYIRRNEDKSFNVWLLPAFQTDGLAVYGGEAVYEIDKTGGKITKDESYFQKAFRGFKSVPPREIWLNYIEQEKPSLGAIFFVWYYKPYFTKIFIDNSESTSSTINAGDNRFIWEHVEKDKKDDVKPKQF
ncbi:MAG: hypothetical protein H7070_11425 [Saprospiraceae bacterium]|nr:hypothetical protein [Pyrinomonadaceae bacterium]